MLKVIFISDNDALKGLREREKEEKRKIYLVLFL
jgi:hypothetical protein